MRQNGSICLITQIVINCHITKELPHHGMRQFLYCYEKRIVTDHRLLLSYGIPSAFGAREFLDVSASTIREIR